MKNEEYVAKICKGMVNTYNRVPIVVEQTYGSWFRDIGGIQYLDLLQNFASKPLGGCPPEIIATIQKQVEKLDSVSNMIYHTGLIYPGKLAEFFGYDMALMTNTGAEAVGKAMKIARKIHKKTKFIVCEGNFHGRTLDVLGASTNAFYTDDFEPFVPEFIKIPFGDAEALRQAIKKNKRAKTFLVEPMQMEGGVKVPYDGYLKECREICNERDVLFILDEVQTGFGRTGKKLCQDYENIQADMTTLGKAMSLGQFGVSSVLGNKGIVDAMESGQCGSTFAGNPLGMAILGKVLEIYKKYKLWEKAEISGAYFMRELQNIGHKHIEEVRGKGLAIGIELNAIDAKEFLNYLLKEERIFTVDAHGAIRLTPALNIKKWEMDFGIDGIKKVLRNHYGY